MKDLPHHVCLYWKLFNISLVENCIEINPLYLIFIYILSCLRGSLHVITCDYLSIKCHFWGVDQVSLLRSPLCEWGGGQERYGFCLLWMFLFIFHMIVILITKRFLFSNNKTHITLIIKRDNQMVWSMSNWRFGL